LPRFTFQSDVFLWLRSFPDLTVEATRVARVILRFGHEEDMAVPDIDEQMIAALDAELPPRGGGYRDLIPFPGDCGILRVVSARGVERCRARRS
jgi:hypothetical protein